MKLWKAALAIFLLAALSIPVFLWHSEQSERNAVTRVIAIRDHYAVQAQAIHDRARAEMEGIDVPAMLSPQTLTSPSGIETNRSKIERLKQISIGQVEATKSLHVRVRSEISSLVDNQKTVTDARTTIQSAWSKREAIESQIALTQSVFISTVSDLNEFMAMRLGDVSVNGEKLRFRREADVREYNRLVGEIYELARRESDLLSRLDQLSQAGQDSLNSHRK